MVDRQRALPRQPGGRGGARPPAAIHEPARARRRGVPAAAHVDRGRGHPRQDDDDEPPRLPPPPGRPRPVVPDRRRARGLRAELSSRRAAGTSSIEGDEYDCAFFDKRPKFVHYLPERGHRRERGVRPRRHLPRPRRGADRLHALPERGPAQAGCSSPGAESPALVEILPKARCRVETFGLHEGADWRADGRADRSRTVPASGSGAGAGTRGSSSWRWRASTTSATPWPRWPRPRRRASSPAPPARLWPHSGA